MDDIAYGDFKDFPKRTTSDKVLCDQTFKIASSPQYDRYQRGLAWIVYEFLDEKARDPAHTCAGIWVSDNQQLANELHKPIIRKFKNHKLNSPYQDVIWGADLAEMQLISR